MPNIVCPTCLTPVSAVRHTIGTQPFASPCCCPVDYRYDGDQVQLTAVDMVGPAANPALALPRRPVAAADRQVA